MVEYQRPEFYVEEFVANEYVAACNEKDYITSVLECTGEEIKLYVAGTTDKLPVDGDPGVGGTNQYGDGGTIYCVGNDYFYGGTISDGKHSSTDYPYVTGEYACETMGGTVDGKGNSTSPKLCAHTTVNQRHHHLKTVPIYHNVS